MMNRRREELHGLFWIPSPFIALKKVLLAWILVLLLVSLKVEVCGVIGGESRLPSLLGHIKKVLLLWQLILTICINDNPSCASRDERSCFLCHLQLRLLIIQRQLEGQLRLATSIQP